jgi:hypothetical protein
MSVKIVRLRNGDDIIADVKEVVEKTDKENILAYRLDNPYLIGLTEQTNLVVQDQVQKINDVELILYPWMPLSADSAAFLIANEVMTIYEPAVEAKERYSDLLEKLKNGTNESSDKTNSIEES